MRLSSEPARRERRNNRVVWRPMRKASPRQRPPMSVGVTNSRCPIEISSALSYPRPVGHRACHAVCVLHRQQCPSYLYRPSTSSESHGAIWASGSTCTSSLRTVLSTCEFSRIR